MVETLENISQIESETIDITEFMEDYRSKDYRKPLYHLPMLPGWFEDNYDP